MQKVYLFLFVCKCLSIYNQQLWSCHLFCQVFRSSQAIILSSEQQIAFDSIDVSRSHSNESPHCSAASKSPERTLLLVMQSTQYVFTKCISGLTSSVCGHLSASARRPLWGLQCQTNAVPPAGASTEPEYALAHTEIHRCVCKHVKHTCCTHTHLHAELRYISRKTKGTQNFCELN